MRGSSVAIQLLATLLLLGGLGLTGYGLLQPPGGDTTYTLTVEQVEEDAPGSRSASVKYSDLSSDGRVAFGRAKLGGSYQFEEDPPAQLESKAYILDGELVYRITITERERISDRLATLFGGTTTAFIGAFVFVSWLDVGQRE